MKKISLFLALMLLLSVFSSCGVSGVHTEAFFFMDTVIGITLYTEDGVTANALFDDCRAILGELDSLWSRRDSTSEIAVFNASADGLHTPDPRTLELISSALDVAKKTNGAFDPTVTPLIDLWEAAGENGKLPTDDALGEALALVGYERVQITEGRVEKTDPTVTLDLGGIGKGAAIQALLERLESSGVEGGLITFGSNVAVFGKKPDGKPFRIALRDPRTAGATVGVLQLGAGEVLSVSGDYERYVTIDGKRYHHILDPASGYPAESGLSSVAVIASDGALADALSTALLVMGKDRALEFYKSGACSFEAILISSDGSLTTTAGLRDVFTPS